MLYYPNHPVKYKYDRLIRYSAHFEDDGYSRIISATYYYHNNNYIDAKENIRKIGLEDLPKIFYSKTMNLTELVPIADSKHLKFYEEKTLKGSEVKELKLEP